MGTVINLPSNPRTLSSVRQATVEMARRYGADEVRRRRAFCHAWRLIAEGSSSAWAIQAARQDLRDGARREAGFGPAAA